MGNQNIYKKQKQQYTQTAAKSATESALDLLYLKNKRLHVESIYMPDTSKVFQAEKESISHACQFTLAHMEEEDIRYYLTHKLQSRH